MARSREKTWIVPSCSLCNPVPSACPRTPVCTHMCSTPCTPTLLPQPSQQGGTAPSLRLVPCCPHTPTSLLEVGTSYYAVAVVRRNFNVTINTLKGVKSCHTGINRTVGWNVPVGYLVESGRLSVMGCDVLKGEDSRPRTGSSGRPPSFPAV